MEIWSSTDGHNEFQATEESVKWENIQRLKAMYSEAEMEQVWELLNVLVEIAVVVHEDVQSGDESETSR